MIIPASKPRLSAAELHRMIEPYGIDREKYPLIAVGRRGYYLNTMGKPGVNDRNMYDDAIFIDAPECFAAFNANTDPSKYQPGIAVLKAGIVYYAHVFDKHKGKYLALCQRAGPVTVVRDGGKEETGYFGINIHRGGDGTTSSLGCQTIPTGQYNSFISLAEDQAQRLYGAKWRTHVVPYLVLEE